MKTYLQFGVLFLSLSLFICAEFNAQANSSRSYSYDKKSGMVKIDNEVKFRMTTTTMNQEASIFPIGSEEELIFIQYRKVYLPGNATVVGQTSVTSSAQSVMYVRILFISLNKEIELSNRFLKDVVLFIDDHQLIKGTKLDEAAIDKLHQKYGDKPFSSMQR
jgi:hypothetical protein